MPLMLAFGEEGADSEVPVADVDSDGCRRTDRRVRELDEPWDLLFDESSSSGLCDAAAGMMLPMRGSRILSPDDDVASAFDGLIVEGMAFVLGVAGLTAAGGTAFSLDVDSVVTGEADL